MSVSIAACTQLVEALPVLAVLKRDVRATTASHLLPALGALSVLESAAPIRTTELAERLSIDNSVASRQVAGLVTAGLVERLRDPDDHRAHRLVLTEAGRRRLGEVRRSVAQRLAMRLDDWDEDDLVALVHLLRRLGTSVKHCVRDEPAPDRAADSAADSTADSAPPRPTRDTSDSTRLPAAAAAAAG